MSIVVPPDVQLARQREKEVADGYFRDAHQKEYARLDLERNGYGGHHLLEECAALTAKYYKQHERVEFLKEAIWVQERIEEDMRLQRCWRVIDRDKNAFVIESMAVVPMADLRQWLSRINPRQYMLIHAVSLDRSLAECYFGTLDNLDGLTPDVAGYDNHGRQAILVSDLHYVIAPP